MKKLFPEQDVNDFSIIFNLLGYKEVSRKKTLFKGLVLINYQKEKDVSNYITLKDRYMPRSSIPFFFVIMFAVLAFGFATAFLIINIVNKDVDKLYYFYILMLPTFASTLIATGISFYRYFVELKNIEKKTAIPLLEKEVR